jgi:hypothetical protein
MNTEGIEKLVHKIRGTFPSQQISFNAVIDAWKDDQFLLETRYEKALAAMPLVEAYGKFPSLPEFRNMISGLNTSVKEMIKCDRCGGSGWDTGQDVMQVSEGQYKVVSWGYTREFDGHEYTCAKKCNCGN